MEALARLVVRPGAWRRWLAAVVVLALPILCALRLAGAWTCATACAGGGHYERLAGVSTLILGLVVYTSYALLIWRDVRRGSWSAGTVIAAWLLVGVSVFYVSILIRLHLWCSHCITVHLLIATLALLLGPTALAWRWRLLALVFGALVMNAAFHHQPVVDVADPDRLPAVASAPASSPAPMNKSDAALLATIDANRSLGSPAAAWRLDLAIDLYCPHCANEHAGLMRALTPLAGEKLRIVTRQVVRTSAPRGAELARYALAAAAIDRPTHAAMTALLLGTRPDTGWAGVRAFVADALDVTAIEAMEARHRDLLVDLVKQDLRELRERGIGASTPALALMATADGRTMRRWTEVVDAGRIAAEVERLIVTR